MIGVTRYDCTTGVEGTPEMEPFSRGDWVSCDDYENLEAELDKLKIANDYHKAQHGHYALEANQVREERDKLKRFVWHVAYYNEPIKRLDSMPEDVRAAAQALLEEDK